MKLVSLFLSGLLVVGLSPAAMAQGDAAMRIRPLEISEWSPKILEKLAKMARAAPALSPNPSPNPTPSGAEAADGNSPRKGGRSLPGMLKTVAHHPDLMDPFLDFSAVLGQRGALTRRDSELLAMRAAWNCQSEFEWGHHFEYALDAGFSKEEIARIPYGPTADGWSASERALLEAADELHARQQISDGVWEKLAASYSDKQLVEVLFVVGQYTMLSMFVNASGVVLEPGYESLPPSPPSPISTASPPAPDAE